MLFLKVGVHLGSSAKIKRKLDPIPQKNLTFLGLFFEAFFDHFLEVSFRSQFWSFWAPKAPKRCPRGHFWERCLVIFLGPPGKVKIELSPKRELSFWGCRGSQIGIFFEHLSSAVPGPASEASQIVFLRIHVNLGCHLGSIWGSLLAHFLDQKIMKFGYLPGLDTTTCFTSPGDLKDLLS